MGLNLSVLLLGILLITCVNAELGELDKGSNESNYTYINPFSFDNKTHTFTHSYLDIEIKYGMNVNSKEKVLDGIYDYAITESDKEIKYGLLFSLENTSKDRDLVEQMDYISLDIQVPDNAKQVYYWDYSDVDNPVKIGTMNFKELKRAWGWGWFKWRKYKEYNFEDLRTDMPKGSTFSMISTENRTCILVGEEMEQTLECSGKNRFRIIAVPNKTLILNELNNKSSYVLDADPTIRDAQWTLTTALLLNGTHISNGVIVQNSQDAVAIWHLDVDSATQLDSTYRGNDGTVNGSTFQNTNCKFGNCYLFDGVNDLINISASNDFAFGTEDLSISFWYARAGAGDHAQETIYSNRGSATQESMFQITYNSDDKDIQLQTYNSSGDNKASKADIDLSSDTSWHYYSIVRSGTDWFIYIDGISQTLTLDEIGGLAVGVAGTDLNFGRRLHTNTRFLNGSLDEIQIFDRALSAQEIKSIYNQNKAIVTNNTYDTISNVIELRDYSPINTSGLVSWWDFRDGTADDRQGSNDGTITGFTSCNTEGIYGLYGQSCEFDGVGDYISVPKSNDFLTTQGHGITVDAWVQTSTTGTRMGIAAIEDGPDNEHQDWDFEIDAANQLKASLLNNAGGAYLTISGGTAGLVNNGEWHHVALVYDDDANSLTIYLDGINVGVDTSTTGTQAIGDYQLTIGVSLLAGAPKWFNGNIADVQIYNHSLSDEEIYSNYLGNRSGDQFVHNVTCEGGTNDKVLWMHFDEDSDMVIDYSGQGNDGTRVNGTSFNASCQYNGCAEFDGTNDYISVSNTISIGTNDFTTESWINLDGIGDFNWVYEASDANHFGLSYRKDDSKFRVYLEANEYDFSTPLTTNVWYHVVVVRSSNNLNMYLNGLQIGGTLTASDNVASTSIVIGSQFGSSHFLNGSIDEFRIYNRALTPTEINTSRDSTVPWEGQNNASQNVRFRVSNTQSLVYNSTNLTAHWKLDGDVNDSLGFSNGTTTGATFTNKTWINRLGGYDFDYGDYLNISDSNNIRPVTKMSVGLWFNADVLNSTITSLLVKDDPSDYQLYFVDPDLKFFISGLTGGNYGTYACAYARSNFNTGEWYYVLGAYDSTTGTASLFVNGVEVCSNAGLSGNIGTSTSNIFIGSDDGGDRRFFDGKIDDIQIYNRSLGAEEIFYLFKTTKPDDFGSWTDYQMCNGSVIDLDSLTGSTASRFIQYETNLSTVNVSFASQFNIIELTHDLTQADTTGPVIQVQSPENITYTVSTIFFNATADETVDTWIINYNGTNITLAAINTSLTVLNGDYQLEVWANDTLGNFGLNDSIFFTVAVVTVSPNIRQFGNLTSQKLVFNITKNGDISGLGDSNASWFYGLFNWTTGDTYNSFNGWQLLFNESKLNETGDVRYVNIDGDNMTGNLNMSNNSIVGINYFLPIIDDTDPVHQEGLLFYKNGNDKTWSIMTEVTGVSNQIGQENWIRGKNTAGETIPNGKAVFISGGSGGRPTFDLGCSFCEPFANIVGLATHDISNNDNGYITTQGLVRDLNTSAWSEGDSLYVSVYPQDGNLTNLIPNYPNFNLLVGIVTDSHATEGDIFVTQNRIDVTEEVVVEKLGVRNGSKLGGLIEIYNFSIGGPTDWNLTSTINISGDLGDIDMIGNLTLGQKITFELGEIIDNIIDGWIRLTGSLNVTDDLLVGDDANITNNLVVGWNVTAQYYFGNISDTTLGYGGETIKQLMDDTLNRGILDALTIADNGSRQFNWTSGEIYDRKTKTIIDISAGIDNCTDNAINYLKWQSGSTLTVSTVRPTSDEIGVAVISCEANDIWFIQTEDILSEREAEMSDAAAEITPEIVTSGLIVTEDDDVTSPWDVNLSAGVYYIDGHQRETVSLISTNTDNLTQWYKTGGIYTATSSQVINNTFWDNGTDAVPINAPKYYRSNFCVLNGDLHWIMGQEEFNTVAQALAGECPTRPAGLQNCVRSMCLILKGNAVALPSPESDQWLDVRPLPGRSEAGTVTDHGNLAGLGDDDHTQYLLADGSRELNGNLNVTGNITLDNGGKIWDNATCTFISSPDGSTVQEICNA